MEINRTSKTTVNMRIENPYQMFTQMSLQAYMAKPICSQEECRMTLFSQKVKLSVDFCSQYQQCSARKNDVIIHVYSIIHNLYIYTCIIFPYSTRIDKVKNRFRHKLRYRFRYRWRRHRYISI